MFATEVAKAPRALLFIDSLKAGGAERITLRWAEWLQSAGWDVVLLTSKNIDHDFYPCPTEIQRWIEPPAPSKRLRWLVWPKRILTLRRLLSKGHFSLLIGVTTIPAIKLTLAAQGIGIPVIVSERNYPPARHLSIPWRILRRIAYPRSTLHLVQTERIARWLRRHHLAVRTACLSNPVSWPLPCHDPVVDPNHWLAPGSKLLLAVGTKLYQKGFDRLVESFALIADRFPSWNLAIVGLDSHLYHGINQIDYLRSLVGNPALQSRIQFPGKIGNPSDWYKKADLFILSSRYEGYPNVLLEAMASGCSCIAYDCPTGPSELMEHGSNGWLIPAESTVSELASSMSVLMSDHQLRERLGMAAMAVRDHNSAERIESQFHRIVASICP